MVHCFHNGSLLFQQVPMVEIDGMKMVQTRAIANYISTKYNLYGKDLKERALIDMYVEGMFDLNELLMTYVIQPADKKEQHYANMMDKTENRYFPVFEKVCGKEVIGELILWTQDTTEGSEIQSLMGLTKSQCVFSLCVVSDKRHYSISLT
uniref:glutathione transferase n=1 Tax=Malurus cyaneus samueli TaxID=2593467 RepID=A0A8C5U1Q7_9PASS